VRSGRFPNASVRRRRASRRKPRSVPGDLERTSVLICADLCDLWASWTDGWGGFVSPLGVLVPSWLRRGRVGGRCACPLPRSLPRTRPSDTETVTETVTETATATATATVTVICHCHWTPILAPVAVIRTRTRTRTWVAPTSESHAIPDEPNVRDLRVRDVTNCGLFPGGWVVTFQRVTFKRSNGAGGNVLTWNVQTFELLLGI
jgi:hypothetical protein